MTRLWTCFASLTWFVLPALVSAAPTVDVASLWVVPTADARRSEVGPHEKTQPLVVGDILYTASLSGRLMAIHREKGFVLWEKQLSAGVEGALTYGRSKLVVGDLAGNLHTLNARDGSEVWKFKVNAEWLAPPALVRDRVYAVSSADDLYSLDLATGRVIWSYSRRGDEKMTVRGTASPTVFASEVFQGFSDGSLVALSADRGEELWARQLRSRDRFYDVDMTPYVDQKSVITSSFDGKLYRLDRLTGEIQWVFPVGSYGAGVADGDRFYFSGLNRNFYALDREAGQVIWKTPYERGIGVRPSLVDKYLVIPTSSDPVYLLNAEDGKLVWVGNLGAGTLAPAGAQGEWFYLLSNYGNLFSFRIVPAVLGQRDPGPLSLFSALTRQGQPD